jgi:hypothetical protein
MIEPRPWPHTQHSNTLTMLYNHAISTLLSISRFVPRTYGTTTEADTAPNRPSDDE